MLFFQTDATTNVEEFSDVHFWNTQFLFIVPMANLMEKLRTLDYLISLKIIMLKIVSELIFLKRSFEKSFFRNCSQNQPSFLHENSKLVIRRNEGREEKEINS